MDAVTGYVEQMKAEAAKRREQADVADDAGLKKWLLLRAAFFDRCAADAEDDIPVCGPVHRRDDGLWYFTTPHGDLRGPYTTSESATTVRDQFQELKRC